MRPPEFTGGNRVERAADDLAGRPGFNEAAGIHRRKRGDVLEGPDGNQTSSTPSMRPPEFTGGNRTRARDR